MRVCLCVFNGFVLIIIVCGFFVFSAETGPCSAALCAQWRVVISMSPIDGSEPILTSLDASRIEDTDVIFETLPYFEMAGDVRLTVLSQQHPDESAKPFCSMAFHTSLMDPRGRAHFLKQDLDILDEDVSHVRSGPAFSVRLEYSHEVPPSPVDDTTSTAITTLVE